MRDIDILSDIKSREEQIARLQEEVSAMKTVAAIYGLNGSAPKPIDTPNLSPIALPTITLPTVVSPKKGFGESKFPIPIGDASAQVLENETNGLHLDTILERIAQLGVTPSRTSLDSALRDGKNKGRFALLGKRIWILSKYV